MELYDAIFYRKSIRNYTNKNVNIELMQQVKEVCSDISCLNKDLKIKAHIVQRGHLIQFLMGKKCKVKAPHYIVVTSNKGDDYLQNIGFATEKVVLQLTSLGLGTCWLECDLKREDMIELARVEENEIVYGKLHEESDLHQDTDNEENDEDEIERPYAVIAFGYPEKQEKLFKSIEFDKDKKRIKHISKKMNRKWLKVMNAVRVSPSIKNIQPWIFYNSKMGINLYQEKQKKILDKDSKISMGIALRHFDIACEKYNIDVLYEKNKVRKKIGKEYYITILEK